MTLESARQRSRTLFPLQLGLPLILQPVQRAGLHKGMLLRHKDQYNYHLSKLIFGIQKMSKDTSHLILHD